ncbi:MAG: hypothetical protein M1837_006544 [Sclerophora amabilis]|nr:MAG: hypothetical protein M1837_006544 [Sclerophora amabilis]
MPRPKKVGGPEPKKRSRYGCWPCKARKIKCGEEKPDCRNCENQGETCDYSIRLNWEGRSRKSDETPSTAADSFGSFRPSDIPGAGSISFSANTSYLAWGSSKQSAVDSGGPPLKSPDEASTRDRPPQNTASPDDRLNLQLREVPQSQARLSSSFETGTLNVPTTLDTESAEKGDVYSTDYRSFSDSRLANPVVKGTDERPQLFSKNNIGNFNLGSPQSPSFRSVQKLDPTSVCLSQTDPGYSLGREPYLPNSSGLMSGPSPPSSQGRYPSSIGQEQQSFSERRAKRMRLSNEATSSTAPHGHRMPPPSAIPPGSTTSGPGAIGPPHYDAAQPSLDSNDILLDTAPSPITPAPSSTLSDESQYHSPSKQPSYQSQVSPDLRRLSVSSLLSGPPENVYATMQMEESMLSEDLTSPGLGGTLVADNSDGTTTYGLDRGYPDLDMQNNDDQNAISAITETARDDKPQKHLGNAHYVSTEFGFGIQAKDIAFQLGGYYAKPLCLDADAFLVALENINLLNLLLAYSATHRARLLNQKEPANRIAIWVRDVFPQLRLALHNNPSPNLGNANLATAIMLASLEIISPNTFGVFVPWQRHLHIAREMIVARGGAHSIHRHDRVSYFLIRWFAYLDVLGSLSGFKNDQPLLSGNSSGYWSSSDRETPDGEDNDYQIDCLLGFTSRCVCILANIAELARQCDSERIGPDGSIRPGWQPSISTRKAAAQLQSDLEEARTHGYRGCTHSGPDADGTGAENEHGWDSLEMVATNEAFHWAGQVHLHRRVLGKPSAAPQVQNAVREIFGALYKVRKGGTAEACLLFPMFTAGCDAREQGQREKIMERMQSVSTLGMTQVHKARTLMQKVWETGKPWETLVTGEFFG